MKYKHRMISASMAALAIAAAVGYEGHNPDLTKKTEVKSNYVAVSPEDFINIYESSVLVHRSLTLEEKCNDSLVMNHIGSGTLLRDSQTGTEYVLTAEHLTVNPFFICKEEDDSYKERSIKIQQGTLTVNGFTATLLKENESADQALLQLKENVKNASPYYGKIAKQLHLDEYVIGVGYPGGKHIYYIANITEKKENWIIINHSNKGGSSGGGIYRFGDQGFELIGTTRGGTAITSLERLQELIKSTPLEDDYL